ncbi:MAG: Putrescine/spermidine transporter ATPase protein [Rhizobacter sp.]|nr:Putrescine/spermidine transporter ATPase protein [Rhizobacter sp.]
MTLSDRIVLMQAGRIRQSGSPADLYRRPVSADVAAFFGSPNLMDADVVACSASGTQHWATVRIGPWTGECRAARLFTQGQQVQVVARPEDIELRDAGAPSGTGDLSLPAIVTDSLFRGGRATVTIAAGGLTLKAEVPALRTPPTGAAVQAVIPRDAMWCVGRDPE